MKRASTSPGFQNRLPSARRCTPTHITWRAGAVLIRRPFGQWSHSLSKRRRRACPVPRPCWCPRPDSNRHALRRGPLRPVRLPSFATRTSKQSHLTFRPSIAPCRCLLVTVRAQEAKVLLSVVGLSAVLVIDMKGDRFTHPETKAANSTLVLPS